MVKHLDAFDELVVGLQTLREPVDEARQLFVLLSSSPIEYEMISSIAENARDASLIEVKEKLFKEYERIERKDTSMKKAFRAGNAERFIGDRGHGRKGNVPHENGGGFKGKCFGCNQVSHMKRNCPIQKGGSGNDAVFAVGEERRNG